MKRPYLIHKKYTGLLRAAFNTEIEAAKVKCPGNCKYNQEVFFEERNISISMCSWGQFDQDSKVQTDKLLICSTNKQARECNTFSPVLSDESDVRAHIKSKNVTPESKRENYPEISILEWVMENDLHKLKEAKLGFTSRIVLSLINKLENLLKYLNKNSTYLSRSQKE